MKRCWKLVCKPTISRGLFILFLSAQSQPHCLVGSAHDPQLCKENLAREMCILFLHVKHPFLTWHPPDELKSGYTDLSTRTIYDRGSRLFVYNLDIGSNYTFFLTSAFASYISLRPKSKFINVKIHLNS